MNYKTISIMRLICPLAVFLLWSISGNAQLSLQLTPPPPGQVNLNSLFHFTVINNSQTTYRGQMEGQLNLSSSKQVYTVRFNVVEIKPGVSSFDRTILQSREQYYGNNPQAEGLKNSGIIPFGNYVLCVILNDATNNDQLAENCLEQEIGPMSPPVLIDPEDEAVIEQKNPLLTWLPPTPLQSNMKLTYSLRLVEIIGKQSPYDAIMRNPILYFEEGLSANSIIYPSSAAPLLYEHKYAWQVTAKSETYTLGQTEVWSFKVSEPKPLKDSIIPEFGSYVQLKNTLDGSYTITVSELRFVHDDIYNTGELRYKITDLTGKDITPKKPLEKKYNDNRMSISLKGEKNFKSNTFYMLEVFGPKNTRQALLFKYFKSEEDFKKLR